MSYPPISSLPTPPSRQEPSTFSDRGDAFLGALPTFQTQVNASGVYIDSKAAEVDTDATTSTTQAGIATTQATNAANSATAAANSAGSAGGVQWVSGTAYAVGTVVFSPIDFQNYRAIQTTSGTTDPSVDTTNWVILGSSFTTGKAIAIAMIFG